jgi:general nucleoside transport system permease protein
MGREDNDGGAGMNIDLVATVLTIVSLATPILLAATGELVAEKSGVLNLGVEGMMLCGAIAGFAVTFVSSDPSYADALPWLAVAAPWLGVVASAAAGVLASLLFGFMVLTLGANQVASGLALVIFGTGISSLIGTAYVGIAIQPFDQIFPDALAQAPIGRLAFGYSPLVYFAFFMVAAVGWFLNRTRAGLVLRAVGENDHSAHSIGYSVIGVRYLAVMFGGAMAGIAGAYFSMVITPLWAEKMTAGRGWIALALVVFSGWRAGRLLGGAYFFAVFMTLELYAKASGFSFLPSQFWASMPYLMAVIVLAVMSARSRGGSEAPACLGKPFIANA